MNNNNVWEADVDPVWENLRHRLQIVRGGDLNRRLFPVDWNEGMEWKDEKPCEIVVCVSGPVFVCDPATKRWSQIFFF